MVGFSGKERRAGESAKSAITSNTKNTVTSLKKLLGKRFASEAITAEMPFATAPIVNVGGEARVAVQYNDEQQMWRVERLMGMMLHHMRQIAETGNEGKPIVDCVISVPPYWSDAERVAMMQSCDIVGLNVLKLMNDSSAAALSYGIYKTDLPEEAQARNVMIFDLGHGDLTVQIVSFSKGKFVVKSIASDLIGTRDLDMLIARHCQTTWQAKHKIDAFESPKSIFRLLTAAEKLRKTLSSIPTSSLAIECFINDVDVAIKVERADLEEWATPWLDKLALTVKRAFELADMTAEDLFACEVIGGGSRIPCVGTALKELVGKEVSRTLNAEEAVARGCALQGAMLSPAFRVRDFSINEVTAYPINIAWSAEGKDDEKVDMETDAAEADVVAPSANGSEIFCRMNVMPCTKMLTLNRSATFSLAASYPENAETPAGTPPKIADFSVSGLPLPGKSADEKTKVKVKVRLDMNGILSVESAQAIDEKEIEVFEDAPKESAPAADEGTPASEGAPAAEPVKIKKIKKKTERHSLPVETTRPLAMNARELMEATEEEGTMALQDRVLIETAAVKNAVESYVYAMRNKLSAELESFTTEEERSSLTAVLDATENWLYEDGEDADKSVYTAKHEELTALCAPANSRAVEADNRPGAITALQKAISTFEALVASSETAHIDASDKEKAAADIEAAKDWLAAESTKQDASPAHADPTLLTAAVDSKCESLKFACTVLNKPKPKPKAEPKPAAEDEAGAAPAAEGEEAVEEVAAAPAAAADMDID